jgi:hypothetical protein
MGALELDLTRTFLLWINVVWLEDTMVLPAKRSCRLTALSGAIPYFVSRRGYVYGLGLLYEAPDEFQCLVRDSSANNETCQAGSAITVLGVSRRYV